MGSTEKRGRLAAALAGVLLLLGPSGVGAAPSAPPDWAALAFGKTVPLPARDGPVTAGDLLQLRDIGGAEVSPDGKWVAFAVRQASLATDNSEIRWFVTPVDGSRPPHALALEGGTPVRTRSAVGVDQASFDPALPRWAPDSRRFAFRRQVGGRIELWGADVVTGGLHRIADGESQVDRFGWTPSGDLVFRTGLNLDRFRTWSSQGDRPWLFDRKQPFWVARTPVPIPPICQDVSHPACDTRTWSWRPAGRTAVATQEELSVLDAKPPLEHLAPGADPRVAIAEAVDPGATPRRRLTTRPAATGPCASDLCVGQFIGAVGWSPTGRLVWMVRRGGAPGETEARGPLDRALLMVWRPESGETQLLRSAVERLDQCQGGGENVVCVQSSATQPARLLAINLDSGHLRVLADPNPSFRTKTFPKIRELVLSDEAGDRGYAQLVYPNGYVPGRTYPLVVTTYRAFGFLRGATGGEYPILPMAAQGFFVLAVDQPDDLVSMRNLTTRDWTRLDRVGQRGVARLARCIDGAVDSLVTEGLVDPRRVAMTGLSWGAMTTHYALQHSDRYAVAITSAGSADFTYLAQFPGGPERDGEMKSVGAQELMSSDPGDYTLARAWSRQPERLVTPLLVNTADGEALMGFEGFAALWRAQRPLEVRVYPDEGHIKFHPRAYAAIYEANLMWLNYWLAGKRDPRPEFADQYRRWDSMRRGLERPGAE
jgi:dipeptidyl aminopeptidase/acylaminoacyl peptidase